MLFNEKGGSMTIDQLATKIIEMEKNLSRLMAQVASVYGVESTISDKLEQTTTTVNKVSERAQYEYVDFKVEKDEAGISLSWDTSSFEQSLPSGQSLRDIRIVADTDKKTIINSNKKSNKVLLDADAANPQIEVRLKIDSKDGVYRYDKVQVLDTTTDGTKSISINPTVPTEERVLSIAEVNDRLMSEITALKEQMK